MLFMKGHIPTGYASFAHDAVWTYALALDKLFNPAGLDTIRTTIIHSKYFPVSDWLKPHG